VVTSALGVAALATERAVVPNVLVTVGARRFPNAFQKRDCVVLVPPAVLGHLCVLPRVHERRVHELFHVEEHRRAVVRGLRDVEPAAGVSLVAAAAKGAVVLDVVVPRLSARHCVNVLDELHAVLVKPEVILL